ncbi:9156_t:CDS:2, partial [Paraglomus occultum]
TELDICNAFYLTDCLDETASDNYEPIGEVVHKAPGEDEAFTHQLNSEADPSVLYTISTLGIRGKTRLPL